MDFRLSIGAKGLIFSILLSTTGWFSVMGQSSNAKEAIRSSYNNGKMVSIISEMESEYEITNKKITDLLTSKGIKATEKSATGADVALKDVGTDGTPLYYTTLNDPASQTSRAYTLYDNGLLNLGLTGLGMNVGIWDSGAALTSHQEFDTRATNADGSGEVSLHSTLVTGNIISSGVEPNAQGVAYGAKAQTYDWSRDKIEVAEAAANGMLLSNHSYGILSDRVPDWYFGAYIKVAQDWDKIMYNAPYYLMVTAAGNAQNSYDNATPNFGKTADGFDLLLGFTVAKNGLTIAGADTEINQNGELTKASVAGYSSFGPVDDGRIKPDLAGDGTNILSTSSATNSSYQVSAGTSMAAPGITGSLLLLQQYHEELFGNYMKAATLKGLALHTADDIGAKGPDYKMGWGVMNAKVAAEVLQNKDYTTLVNEENLTNGNSYSIKVTADGNGPLMASISWTDPEAVNINRGDLNSTTAAIMNDLDIRITKGGETYLPWKLNPAKANDAATKGDNKVDPYERIDIDNASGEYTITITHKGSLTNGLQDFSLIVSGAQISTCSLEVPTGLEVLDSSKDATNISWEGIGETLYEVQFKSIDTDEWNSEMLWESEFTMTDLEVGKVYEARVRSICTENAVSEFSDILEFEFNGEETQIMQNAPLTIPQELNISVYPNPAVSYLNVEAELSQDAQYSIVTTSGNVIKKGKTQGSINVSSLSSGLYVLVVQDYAGIKSTKFYKN
ncbi:S8 family serine peptidase [Flagellimonas zhangzhouensis]|uniref:Por secretion system C-terminal sorting domain-containing protein n=1 Tax=Flagellimonas zhangzhouensis TaxID=1073328 RepID=A0A1H2UJL1_9FLAO|nr:S8 family serine peptidase [Allomuricauda zhangzhouensis]SDQ16414.1 Por secretion system C-terminal sorting domain-containing protein [Allomuricauda zhangzhouensis]SDW56323.1 Por secretion system C-terminal sorting domain-containing protein [Allomuricauda zhangzhouensis]